MTSLWVYREAKLLPDYRGVVVLTNAEQFFMVANFDEPRVRQMADIPSPDPEAPAAPTPGLPTVTSWVVHLNVEERNIEVIAAAHRALFVLDTNEARFPSLMQGQQVPYERMSISPSGRLIALFGNSKINVRLTTDLTAEITSFDTMSKVAPRQLEWCGSDSVVAYWDQLGEGYVQMRRAGVRERERGEGGEGGGGGMVSVCMSHCRCSLRALCVCTLRLRCACIVLACVCCC